MWVYQSVTNVGVQVLVLMALGWLFARFKLLEQPTFLPQSNFLVLMLALPAFNLYLMGIRLDLQDPDPWKAFAAFLLWTFVVQSCILMYTWRFCEGDAGEAAVINMVLLMDNYAITGLLALNATLGTRWGTLALLMAMGFFLAIFPFSLAAFEWEKWAVQQQLEARAEAVLQDIEAATAAAEAAEESTTTDTDTDTEGPPSPSGPPPANGGGGAAVANAAGGGGSRTPLLLTALRSVAEEPRADERPTTTAAPSQGPAAARTADAMYDSLRGIELAPYGNSRRGDIGLPLAAAAPGGGLVTRDAAAANAPAVVEAAQVAAGLAGASGEGAPPPRGGDRYCWWSNTDYRPINHPLLHSEDTHTVATETTNRQRLPSTAPNQKTVASPAPPRGGSWRRQWWRHASSGSPRASGAPQSPPPPPSHPGGAVPAHGSCVPPPLTPPPPPVRPEATTALTTTEPSAAAAASVGPVPLTSPFENTSVGPLGWPPASPLAGSGGGGGGGGGLSSAPPREGSSLASCRIQLGPADRVASGRIASMFRRLAEAGGSGQMSGGLLGDWQGGEGWRRGGSEGGGGGGGQQEGGVMGAGGATGGGGGGGRGGVQGSAGKAVPLQDLQYALTHKLSADGTAQQLARLSMGYDAAAAACTAAAASPDADVRRLLLAAAGGTPHSPRRFVLRSQSEAVRGISSPTAAAPAVGVMPPTLSAPTAVPDGAALTAAAANDDLRTTLSREQLGLYSRSVPMAVYKAAAAEPTADGATAAGAPEITKGMCSMLASASATPRGRRLRRNGTSLKAPPSPGGSPSALEQLLTAATALEEAAGGGGRATPSTTADRKLVRLATAEALKRHGGLARAFAAFVSSHPQLWHIVSTLAKNPMIWTLFIAMAVSVTGFRVFLDPASPRCRPELGWVAGSLSWINGLVVPLSIFSNGVWMYGKPVLPRGEVTKMMVLLLIKMGVLPLLMAGCGLLLRLNGNHVAAMTVLTLSPAAATSFVLAVQYGRGVELVSLTNILGNVFLTPLLIMWLKILTVLHVSYPMHDDV